MMSMRELTTYLAKSAAVLALISGGTYFTAKSLHAELVYEEEVEHESEVELGNSGAEIESETEIERSVEARPSVQGRESDRRGLKNEAKYASRRHVDRDRDDDGENLTRSEMLRKERMREELKNEDLLQQRLEELRLRDEEKRTDKIFNGKSGKGNDDEAANENAKPVVQQDVIVASHAVPVTGQYVESDLSDNNDEIDVSIGPRVGISNINDNGSYDISSRYTLGAGLGVGVSDNLSVEFGYQYSEYGVDILSSNPFVRQAQALNNFSGGGNGFETIAMKQNIFDLSMKLYMLDRESKFRPFVGAGLAYGKSFINYDESVLQWLNHQPFGAASEDYELSQYLGSLSAGFDIKISDNIAIGAMLKYYAVLSSRENQQFNNFGFVNPGNAIFNGAYNGNLDKQAVGGSIGDSSFYSLLVGMNFTF